MASNTPHHRFASIVRRNRIPVINIFEVVEESARIGQAGSDTRHCPDDEIHKLREAFAKYGVEAAARMNEESRSMTAGLIIDLQVGSWTGRWSDWGALRDLVPATVQGRPSSMSSVHGVAACISQRRWSRLSNTTAFCISIPACAHRCGFDSLSNEQKH